MGGKLVGAGLAIGLDEYVDLVEKHPKNAEVLRPYLGGEEVNSNPRGDFERYLIDFSEHSLDAARAYPQLMDVVEAKVRPVRENDKRGTYKTYWWRPGESGGALYLRCARRLDTLLGGRKCNEASHVLHATHELVPQPNALRLE